MEGPRSCAGQALAVMNLTATLAMLYGAFTFRLADEVTAHAPASPPGSFGCAPSSNVLIYHFELVNLNCHLAISGVACDQPRRV